MQALFQEFLNFVSNLQGLPAESLPTAFDTIQKYYSEMEPSMMGFALYKLAEQIVRWKAVPEPLFWLADQCLRDLISRIVLSEFRFGTEALRMIFDVNL